MSNPASESLDTGALQRSRSATWSSAAESVDDDTESASVRADPRTDDRLWGEIGSVTAIFPIVAEDVDQAVDDLRAILEEIDAKIRAGASPLAKIPGVHVARWVLLPARVREQGRDEQPTLVMWNVFDGTRWAHLKALAEHARPLLDQIYSGRFPGYPPADAKPRKVARFLARHAVKDGLGRVAAFVGTPGASVETVRMQEKLAGKIATRVRQLAQDGLSNEHIFLEIRKFVRDELECPTLAAFAALRPTKPRFWPLSISLVGTVGPALLLMLGAIYYGLWFFQMPHVAFDSYSGIVVAFLFRSAASVAVLFLTLSLLLTAWGFGLRRAENREARRFVPVPRRDFLDHHAKLRERDNDGPGMNRLTILTDVKPGIVRRVTLRFVLWLVNYRASRNLEGNLEGIPTIHFAQWRLVDGNRRLLFMSNYDGPALSYFQDFSNNATPGLNAIWGNTEGMPNTTALIGEGSRDLEAFENAARVNQVVTDAWFCGYASRRNLTTRINENWLVHQRLHEFPTPTELAEWVGIVKDFEP